MDEFALIQRFFTSGSQPPGVRLGVGDDCAVLEFSASEDMVVSVDTVVAGGHFPHAATAAQVATRAFCTALSDVAAMGANPWFCTLALTAPQGDPEWFNAFSQALRRVTERFNCALVGGDTTQGPLAVTVQVTGRCPQGQALLRSGAQAGDTVWVSGCLGDGAAALAWLQGQMPVLADAAAYLTQRFYEPEPQLQLGQQLRALATAALDVSDGLVADLQHICHASRVALALDLDRLPIAPVWGALVSDCQAEDWALAGGDDYQLVFCAPASARAAILALGVPVTEIGRVLEGSANAPAITFYRHGSVVEKTVSGFKHFA